MSMNKSSRQRRKKVAPVAETVETTVMTDNYIETVYQMWVNAMRYIELKGKAVPDGYVIRKALWLRIKRILGKPFVDLTEDDLELIQKMMEWIE